MSKPAIKATRRSQPEAKIQQAVFEWIEWHSGKHPLLRFAFHSPNGGSRNLIEARHLKAGGVKPGVPDLLLPVPCGQYQGLAIEFKAGRNKTTDAQDFWLNGLAKSGYLTGVARSVDEAISLIRQFLTHQSNSISPNPSMVDGQQEVMENMKKVESRVVIKVFYPEIVDGVFVENTGVAKMLLLNLGLYNLSRLEVLGRKTWFFLTDKVAIQFHESIGKVWFADEVTADQVIGVAS